MADMSIEEIETHLANLDNQAETLADQFCIPADETDPGVSASIIRQLLKDREWRDIDDQAKNGKTILINDGDTVWPAVWDEAGDKEYPWKLFDDGEENRMMEKYVVNYTPLPSPTNKGE